MCNICIAIISAIIATFVATTVYFLAQYFALGDLFLNHGVLPFVVPGFPVMLGLGTVLNLWMLRRGTMHFESLLRIYGITGAAMSAAVIIVTVALDIPWSQTIGGIFGDNASTRIISAMVLMAMSIPPLATYIFVTNWTVNFLRRVLPFGQPSTEGGN